MLLFNIRSVLLFQLLTLCVCETVLDNEGADLESLAVTVYRNPNFYSNNQKDPNFENFGVSNNNFQSSFTQDDDDDALTKEYGLSNDYKYPGETKSSKPKRPYWKHGYYDDHPDFLHAPRDVARDPSYKPYKGRGPYGHPRYKDQDSFLGDYFNDPPKYGQINPVSISENYENAEPKFFKTVEKITNHEIGFKEEFIPKVQQPKRKNPKLKKQKKWKSKKYPYSKLYLVNKEKHPEHILIFHHLESQNKQQGINPVVQTGKESMTETWSSTPLDARMPFALNHEEDIEYEHLPQTIVDKRHFGL